MERQNERELLIFVCNPTAAALPGSDDEAAEVSLHVAASIKRGGTAEDLRTMLVSVPTRMFLFIGHGNVPFATASATGALQRHTLAFACPSGGLVTVKPDDLCNVLGSHAPEPLEFVFLNGCCTAALGQACFDAGVPTVVCWKTRVENRAARVFSTSFFEAVGKGYSYARAFEQAIVACIAD